MLKLPEDPFATLEIVHDPARGAVEVGTGIDHLVVQVDSLDATGADLRRVGGSGAGLVPRGGEVAASQA